MLDVIVRYTLFRRPATDQAALRSAVEAAHPDRATEVQQMTQTYAPELIEQGRQEGRQEGWQEGELQTLRETLVRLARLRFRQLPSEGEQRVTSLNDAERLRHALDLVVQAEKLEDLGV